MSSDSRGGRGLALNLLWLFALVGLVLATFYLVKRKGNLLEPSRETAVVRVFREASPAVVNISAEPLAGGGDLSFLGRRRFPSAEEFFRQFFGEQESKSDLNLGSGIIVDPRGYILTNEHVVANTAWIQIKLADGRAIPGEVWATEPTLDLAVIKIAVEDPLPYLAMREKDDVMIGESVVVIGNPLGLGHTCTTGIVSALHRAVKIDQRVYQDLIQIDAAVNPGNSGGPLLNIRGDLIGITTALNSEAQGIGFAIPISQAREVVDDLIRYRYVPTGWLGVSVEDLAGAAEAFDLKGTKGVFISRIDEGGPAAGVMRAGDILLEWDGVKITGVEDFAERARGLRAGQKIKFRRLRDKDEKSVKIETAAFPERLAEEWAWWHLGMAVEQGRIKTRTRDGQIVEKSGVFVSQVAPSSPAGAAGLSPGDLILRLNRETIEDKSGFNQAIVRLRARKNIFVIFQRGAYPLWVTVPFRAGGEMW